LRRRRFFEPSSSAILFSFKASPPYTSVLLGRVDLALTGPEAGYFFLSDTPHPVYDISSQAYVEIFAGLFLI